MREGTAVSFRRVGGGPATGDYTMVIRAVDGRTRTKTFLATLAETFSVEETELFPDVNNTIRIQPQLDCGLPGYGARVSYAYSSSGNPVSSTGVTRVPSGATGRSNVWFSATAGALEGTSTVYHLYYRPATEGTTGSAIRLTKEPLPTPVYVLKDQPAGAGYGEYWFVPWTNDVEGLPGPVVVDDERNVGASPEEPATALPVAALYVHSDHLGSTRLVTDELGVPVARSKFYPFGQYAEYSDTIVDNRMQFTGHERDRETGLDYMSARYYNSSLARFVSVDPGNDIQVEDPQSWDKYAYVRNTPLNATDPTGRLQDWILTNEFRVPAQASGEAPAATLRLSVSAAGVALIGGASVSANLNVDNKGGASVTLDAQAKFGFGMEIQAGPSVTLQPGTVKDIKPGEVVTVSGGYLGEGSVSVAANGGSASGSIKSVGVGGSITVDIGGPVVTLPISEPTQSTGQSQPEPVQRAQSATKPPRPEDPKQRQR